MPDRKFWVSKQLRTCIFRNKNISGIYFLSPQLKTVSEIKISKVSQGIREWILVFIISNSKNVSSTLIFIRQKYSAFEPYEKFAAFWTTTFGSLKIDQLRSTTNDRNCTSTKHFSDCVQTASSTYVCTLSLFLIRSTTRIGSSRKRVNIWKFFGSS